MLRKFAIATLCFVALSLPAALCEPAKPVPVGELYAPPPPANRVLKKRVAVVPPTVSGFRIIRGNVAWDDRAVAATMADLMTTALVATDRFVVMNRTELDKVVAEQQLGQAGLTSPDTAPKVGRLIGVEYLIVPSVTEATVSIDSKAASIAGIRVGRSKITVTIGADIHVINTATSEVVAAKHVQHAASDSRTDFAASYADIAIGSGGTADTPVGKAVGPCVDEWIEYAVRELGSDPWRSRVAAVDADGITITGGTDKGLRVGDRFEVLHQGDEIRDPDTGQLLGVKSSLVGLVEVMSVADKFSTCRAPASSQPIERGDILREFAGSWDGKAADPKQAQAAQTTYNAALSWDPNNPEIYAMRGAELASEGKTEQAMADLAKALEIDPNCAAARDKQGAAYLSQGKFDAAITDFSKALDLGRRTADVYTGRGTALLQGGQPDDAIQDLKQALQLDPGAVAAIFGLGTALYAKGDYGGAVDEFTRATKVAPTWPDPLVGIALARFAAGDTKGAAQGIDAAIKAFPDALRPLYGRALLLEAQGRPRDALEQHRRIADLAGRIHTQGDRDTAQRSQASIGRLEGAIHTGGR